MHDVTKFLGSGTQPNWAPIPDADRYPNRGLIKPDSQTFLFDDVVSSDGCQSLIDQFEQQELYPVGVNGYCNSAENAGSWRAMGWSVPFVRAINQSLFAMPRWIKNAGYQLSAPGFIVSSPLEAEKGIRYEWIGSTPWLRFMRYSSGGMHTPHYDASFHQPDERYRSLFSWVLYLSDADESQGGRFQFVDDRQQPNRLTRTDWARMANEDEISLSVSPRVGRLLVFPHWRCHQVEAFIGNAVNPFRYIIRGDLAYGY